MPLLAVIRHDVFNIVYVLALFVCDIIYMTTGHGFWVLWYSTVAYFIIDGVWVSNGRRWCGQLAMDPGLAHHPCRR